jgi:hypothetical protein
MKRSLWCVGLTALVLAACGDDEARETTGGGDASGDATLDSEPDAGLDAEEEATESDTTPDAIPDAPEETSRDVVPDELTPDALTDVVTEPDAPANTSPTATADPIETDVSSEATTQIDVTDPDEGDSHTFEITEEAVLGEASVSDSGLVTYRPGLFGADEVTVTITDSADAGFELTITITVTGVAWTGFAAVPEELCGSDVDYVSVVSIDPVPGTRLSGETQDFAVTFSYALSESFEFGLVDPGAAENALTVLEEELDDDLCGTIAVEGPITLSPTSNRLDLRLMPFRAPDYNWPLNTETAVTTVSWDTVSIPIDTVITDPIFSFWTTFSVDLKGDHQLDEEGWVQVGEESGYGGYYPSMNPNSVIVKRPLQVVGTLGCGESYARFELYSSPANLLGAEQYLSFAAIPPPLSVEDTLTRQPLTGEDVTRVYTINNCLELEVINLSASDDWFTVSSPLVLRSEEVGDVEVTYHADRIDVGSFVEGTLTISRVEGPAFDPIEIPVSAFRHDFDLTSGESPYAQHDLIEAEGTSPSDDDGAFEILLTADDDLSSISIGAEEHTSVWLSTNGVVGIGDCDPAALYSYSNVTAFYTDLDPDWAECLIIAALWSDLGFFSTRDEGDVPSGTLYTRFGRDDDGAFMEIVFWNLHAYSDYTFSNVIVVTLRGDGNVRIDYPQVTWLGMETVGWFAANGGPGELVEVATLSDGSVLEFNLNGE